MKTSLKLIHSIRVLWVETPNDVIGVDSVRQPGKLAAWQDMRRTPPGGALQTNKLAVFSDLCCCRKCVLVFAGVALGRMGGRVLGQGEERPVLPGPSAVCGKVTSEAGRPFLSCLNTIRESPGPSASHIRLGWSSNLGRPNFGALGLFVRW